jgi:hypothetical protein
MARYLARPPIANERLRQIDDGQLELRLKRRWRDGPTALHYTPGELIERLVAIVPRPRAHVVRYHGVFAPAFAARSQIVPDAEAASIRAGARCPPGAEPPVARERFPWASLIWRVFLEDVLSCGRCAGRMRVAAAVTSPPAIRRVLEHLGVPTEPPTFHVARPPPPCELPFDPWHALATDEPARDEFDA